MEKIGIDLVTTHKGKARAPKHPKDSDHEEPKNREIRNEQGKLLLDWDPATVDYDDAAQPHAANVHPTRAPAQDLGPQPTQSSRERQPPIQGYRRPTHARTVVGWAAARLPHPQHDGRARYAQERRRRLIGPTDGQA